LFVLRWTDVLEICDGSLDKSIKTGEIQQSVTYLRGHTTSGCGFLWRGWWWWSGVTCDRRSLSHMKMFIRPEELFSPVTYNEGIPEILCTQDTFSIRPGKGQESTVPGPRLTNDGEIPDCCLCSRTTFPPQRRIRESKNFSPPPTTHHHHNSQLCMNVCIYMQARH